MRVKQRCLFGWAGAYQEVRQQYYNEFEQKYEYEQQLFSQQQQQKQLQDQQLYQMMMIQQNMQSQQQQNQQQNQQQQQQQQQQQLKQGQQNQQGEGQQLNLNEQQQQLLLLKQQYQNLQLQQQQLVQQQQNTRYQNIQSDQLKNVQPSYSEENEYFTEEPIAYTDVPNFQNNPQFNQSNSQYNQNALYEQQRIASHPFNQVTSLHQYKDNEQDMADLLFDKPRQYIPQQSKEQSSHIQQHQTFQSKQSANFLSQDHLVINEQSEEHESGNDSQLQKYLRVSQSEQQDDQNESYQDNLGDEHEEEENDQQIQDDDEDKEIQEGEDEQKENERYSDLEVEEYQQYTLSQDQQMDQQDISQQQSNISGPIVKDSENYEQIQQQFSQNNNISYDNQIQSQSNKSDVKEYLDEDDFFEQLEEEDSDEQSNSILYQYLQHKQQEFSQMVFNVWRKCTIDKKLKRLSEEETIQSAYQVYERNLMGRLFAEWKVVSEERINMSKQQKRSYLYACFSSWKMYSKEKKLLKKYLSDAEMDEQLAYTPQTTERMNLLFNNNDTKSINQNFQRSGSFNNLEASNKTSSDSQKSSSMASGLFTGKLKIQDTLNMNKNAPH